MFVGKWRFDINHKRLFELFLVKGWRRLFTRSQVEANWFFAEPSEYIFCLKNLIGNQGVNLYDSEGICSKPFVYHTNDVFNICQLYFVKKCDFSSLLFFLQKTKAGKHKRFIYFLFSGSSICYSREAKQWIRLHNA